MLYVIIFLKGFFTLPGRLSLYMQQSEQAWFTKRFQEHRFAYHHDQQFKAQLRRSIAPYRKWVGTVV